MILRNIGEILFPSTVWEDYDAIFLASGFEERSRFILDQLPRDLQAPCFVLGFVEDKDKLSRRENDAAFSARGFPPHLCYSDLLEDNIRTWLEDVMLRPAKGEFRRILIDYSVMTRSWYAFFLTWLRYSQHTTGVDVDFLYTHGSYLSNFEPLHIRDVSAIPGFEGSCSAARRTVALFGLGFDRYASLAVHEQIEPDEVVCLVAQDSLVDPKAERVLEENKDILGISGVEPIRMPLGNMPECVRIMREQVDQVDASDEVVFVLMGPKPHVLAGLLVSQLVPRVTCLHARGYRKNPVQVAANGKVSLWRLAYR